MVRKMIIGLVMATSLLASGTVTAAPSVWDKDTTIKLCEMSGFLTAGGMGNPFALENQRNINDMTDVISSRSDYNEVKCKQAFRFGAIVAAESNLNEIILR